MRFSIVAVALLVPLVSAAQQTPGTPLRIAASSFASVEVHLNSRRIGDSWYEEDASLTGPSRIAITYGQPRARTLAEPEGSLTIYLVPDAAQPTTGYAELRGALRIKWGSTELSTVWRVDR
jgi:hypothetical protein